MLDYVTGCVKVNKWSRAPGRNPWLFWTSQWKVLLVTIIFKNDAI